jgi:peptidoglycan/xylan/chitin deacetylase (PgdA/CDA1 family)
MKLVMKLLMKVALTFDIERDNPNFLDTYYGVRVGLLKILTILDKYHIKGTFFCTGNVAEHLPEYVRIIERKGHEIACHGLNHERLTQLNFNKCQDSISGNKEILENICHNTEILGFRAPYLKPPKFLFKVLNNLGFKYDSSVKSYKELYRYQLKNYKIQEFSPSNFSIFFRLPMSYYYLRKRIFEKSLVILYFHPWEAINMNDIIFNQSNLLNILKNMIFRPDRRVNTGDSFIEKLSNFINESISKNVKFVVLKQLLNEK